MDGDPNSDPGNGAVDEGQSPIIDADGNLAENWLETLPEEMRKEKCLETVTGWQSLISQYVNGQKAIGKNKVVVPTETSSEAEWDAFYKAIGRPETVDDYKAEVPEELSEILDANRLAAYKDFAHKHGVSEKLFNEFLNFEVQQTLNLLKEDDQAEERAMMDAKQELIKRWGAAYDERKHLADRVITVLRPDPESRIGILEKYGNDPDFLELLSDAGMRLVEGKPLTVEVTGAATPKEAEAQLSELRSTPGFILRFADGPHKGKYLKDVDPERHKAIIQKQQELIKKAYPSQKATG